MYSAPRHFARAAFDPASRTPGIFVADSHRPMLSALLRGIAARDPFITVIGEAGVGKTTLVNAALPDQAGGHARVIRVSNPPGAVLSLRSLGAQITGRERVAEDDADRALAALTDAEHDVRRVALIVDDAHALTAEAMRFLLRASEVARSRSVFLQVIFVGRPSFRDVLRQHDPEGQIPAGTMLEPLSGAEALDYIRRHLALAGMAAEQVLTEAALMAIATQTDGFPARINALLERELLAPRARGGAAEADSAMWLCSQPVPGPAERARSRAGGRAVLGIGLAIAAVAVLAGGLLARHLLPSPVPRPHYAAPASQSVPRVAALPAPPVGKSEAAVTPPRAMPQPEVRDVLHGVTRMLSGLADAGADLARIRAELLDDIRLVDRRMENHNLAAPIIALLRGLDMGRAALAATHPATATQPVTRGPEPSPADRDLALAQGPRLTLLPPPPPPPEAGTWLDEVAMRESAAARASPVRVKAPEYGSRPPVASAPSPSAAAVVGAASPSPSRHAMETRVTPPRSSAAAARTGGDAVGRLISRGDAMLVAGDVAGARPFYARAAADDSGAAATRMGKTYDPRFLAGIEADDVAPDRATAAAWYRRAVALGDAEAWGRLKALNTRQRGD